VALKTRVSADGRTAIARVDHLSRYDFVQRIPRAVGSLLSTRVDPPRCRGEPPTWIGDVVHIAPDPDDPVIWCAGRDPKRASTLVVKVAVNRGYGMLAAPATKPAWSHNSGGTGSFAGEAVLAVLNPGNPIARLAADGGELVPGGATLSLGFTEASVRALRPGTPLVRVQHTLADLTIGLLYDELLAAFGDDDAPTSRPLAAAIALVHVAQCLDDLHRADSAADVTMAAVDCLARRAEDVVRAVVNASMPLVPVGSERKFGGYVGRGGRVLRQAARFALVQQLGEPLTDIALLHGDAAWTLTVWPTYQPPLRVSEERLSRGPRERPDVLVFGDDSGFGQLEWSSWGGDTATATGVFTSTGGVEGDAEVPVQVTLASPRRCGPYRLYTSGTARALDGSSAPWGGDTADLPVRCQVAVVSGYNEYDAVYRPDSLTVGDASFSAAAWDRYDDRRAHATGEFTAFNVDHVPSEITLSAPGFCPALGQIIFRKQMLRYELDGQATTSTTDYRDFLC